ncbi:hypothetical protein [Methanogenium cariaci]|uniref:hypothetical protein n=1 Tax=Methanogenium cariaci TaxID=2197 RepID=UPI0012F6EBE6|nr:hypothetical protein [Methanogenium cariaci]
MPALLWCSSPGVWIMTGGRIPPAMNETERAIAIALADPEVQENIPRRYRGGV